MPNLFPFCKKYNPTELPPPLHEQINERAQNTWHPERCHFAYALEPETRIDEDLQNRTYQRIQTNDPRAWNATGRAALRREIICMEHTRARPMLYLRMWSAARHYQELMQKNYHIERSTIDDHPEIVLTVAWLPPHYPITWWVLNRPPAQNLHTHWIRNGARVTV